MTHEKESVKKPVLIILIVTLGFGACVSTLHRGNSAALWHGTTRASHPPAPEFSLTDLSGKKLDLAAYRGKVVLLNFWATWCAPCRAEIPRLVELENKYRKRSFRIIGISLDDDTKPVRMFYEQFKMNYPVALGDAALAERYGGILGLPVTFLIGCDGRVYARRASEIDVFLLEPKIRRLLEQTKCK